MSLMVGFGPWSGSPVRAEGGILPYSADQSVDVVRRAVEDELISAAHEALLDNPAPLGGVALARIRLVPEVDLTPGGEEGYHLAGAQLRVLVPEGAENRVDREQIRATLERAMAARVEDWGPVQILDGAYQGKARAEFIGPWRWAAAVSGGLAGVLVLLALLSEVFQRRRMKALRPVWIVKDLTIAQSPAMTMATSRPSRPESRQTGDGGPPQADVQAVPSAASGSLVRTMALRPRREQLPGTTLAAIDALAKLPLDEALGVLQRFQEEERGMIIEHLPVHPALKQRLLKGLHAY